MPISKPHSTLGAKNNGSCKNLAFYLNKENEELDKLIVNKNSKQEQQNLQNRKQYFFSHTRTNISTIDVIESIDRNKRKLSKNDAKYFAPTISFSQNELNHILSIATKREKESSIWNLNLKELAKYNELLREYTRLIMDNYALNFNRQEKDLKSGNDLLYFAKIEHFRKYKGTDKDVKKGIVKSGDLKPGIQSHVHLIVSRKDKTQRLKLSPMSNEKSTKRKIGNNNYHVGFDRVKWINLNEKSFDSFFHYKRPELEKFETQNILKNGSPKEKELELKRISSYLKEQTISNNLQNNFKNAENNINHTSKRRSW